MKRLLLLLLITITCLNLTGSYAIAAAVLAHQSATSSTAAQTDAGEQQVKKSVIDLQTIQVNKDDSEDELFSPLICLSVANAEYNYIPDFKLLNKHFLLHYGISIKDKELDAYILHQNFRL